VESIVTTPGVGVRGGSTRRPHLIIDALATTERQVWLSPGQPGLVRTRVVGPIRFLSAAARRQWIRWGRPAQQPGLASFRLPADGFDLPYRSLASLPSDVDALWTFVRRRAGNGDPHTASMQHEMSTVIGDLLREDPVPSKVRAALFRVAERIPGIELLGRTRDALGRPALAVALNDVFDGQREELLFDPRTAQLLGEASVVVTPPPTYHVMPNTVHSGATYVTSGIVDRIGQLP
jgi:hypothetical protein